MVAPSPGMGDRSRKRPLRDQAQQEPVSDAWRVGRVSPCEGRPGLGTRASDKATRSATKQFAVPGSPERPPGPMRLRATIWREPGRFRRNPQGHRSPNDRRDSDIPPEWPASQICLKTTCTPIESPAGRANCWRARPARSATATRRPSQRPTSSCAHNLPRRRFSCHA